MEKEITHETARRSAPVRVRWRHSIAMAIAALATVLCIGGGEAAAQTRPASRGAPAPAATSSATASPSASGVVDVNTAGEEQLVLLPGIGPTKARAILAARQRMGRFRRVEDLLRVRGIGRATLRRIRNMVSLQGGTTMTTRAATSRSAPPADGAGEE